MRWRDGEIEPLFTEGKPFYGLTWDHEHVYVGARCWDQARGDHLIVLDRELNIIEEYKLPSAAIHQILWHDGWVYLTDTRRDRVLRWKPDKWEIIFDLGTNEDVFHINSLWHDGKHWWAAGLHGHIWCDWQASDWLTFEIHNVYREDGRTILGASDQQAISINGVLVSLEQPVGVMQEPTDLWRAYTRGLARGPGHFYVGASAVENERSERQRGNSAIVVFDDDWRCQDVLRFEDTGGMHDIRVMGPDRAHNGVEW